MFNCSFVFTFCTENHRRFTLKLAGKKTLTEKIGKKKLNNSIIKQVYYLKMHVT